MPEYAFSHTSARQAEFLWHDTPSVWSRGCRGFARRIRLWRLSAVRRDRPKFSPVMAAVKKFAADGGPVLGICYGFSDSRRERVVTRGAVEESRVALCLPRRDAAGRSGVAPSRRAKASCCGCLWRMARAAIFADNKTLDML